MSCPICKNGSIIEGYTTLIFEKKNSTIVLKKVPADVCDNCSEAFITEEISKKVFNLINKEIKKGVEVEVLHFAA